MDLTIPCFDPALIARSGQCFRMREGKGGIVTALAGADRVRVTPLGGDRFRFDCPPEDFERRWRAYFDLDTDYEAIQREAAGQDELLAHAACACRGLSIPAIQTCVEALCTRCGAKVGRGRGRYFAFPGPEDLLRAGERGLRACGTGYRAPYLLDAARRVADGRADLDAMAALPDDELLEQLEAIHGVGVKVASCVMLFGYHRLASAPVDVWIRRVIDEDYGGRSPFPAYGEHAGIFQQYLFYGRIAQKG